jgi:hypothetical protein
MQQAGAKKHPLRVQSLRQYPAQCIKIIKDFQESIRKVTFIYFIHNNIDTKNPLRD